MSTVNATVSTVKLQREMELLQVQLANLKEKISEVENERDILLARQFSMDKIKDDDSAVLVLYWIPKLWSTHKLL